MNSRLFILSSVIVFIFAEGSKLPFELKEERKFSAVEIFPIDINQDKVDELLRIGKNNIQLFDQKGRFYWDFYFTLFLPKSISVCDFNKDGIKEFFLNHTEGVDEIVDCYRTTKPNDLIKRLITITGIDQNRDGKWDGGITAIDGIDANDDGKLDLLLNVGCSFDLQPRGLAVYDIETGKELWHYWIGPAVDKVILEDLNNDGKQEIVIGTYSTANGSEANNTSDTESYVIVLNRKGELLWQKPIGEYFTFTLIAVSNLDQESTKEVIAAQSTRKQGNEEPDKLVILDGKNGKEKRLINTGENFYGLACVDLDHDGIVEIITGNSDGEIRVFNSELDEIRSYHNPTGIKLIGMIDLNGDGRKEIITTSEDAKLIILNEKLKIMAQLELANSIFYSVSNDNQGPIKTIKNHDSKKLLIMTPKEGNSEFVLYSMVPIVFTRWHYPILIIILLTIIIIFNIAFFARRALLLESNTMRKSILEKSKQIGIIFLNKKGKILMVNQKATNLLGIDNLEGAILKDRLKEKGYMSLYEKISDLKPFEDAEIILNNSEGEKILLVSNYKIKGKFFLRFTDMTEAEHLKKIEDWVPIAQKLAHGIKTPLMNIQLAAQQIVSKPDSNEQNNTKLLDNINQEVNRLRKLTDGFMRYTQLTQPLFSLENINVIIKDLIDKYLVSLPKNIKFKYDLDEKIPKLIIDKTEFENALSIIFDNAIEAMGKQGILTITTLLQQKFQEKIKDWIRIEITDTGKGIPEKYINDLFKPYFVYDKPNGTGLGLTLTKKIIENHNGNIEMQSKEGIGTSVIIELPIAK